ncbi:MULTISPECIES: DUF5970 family protein [Bacillus]|uniref:DUF5970 family protein n=1 Tax=Bacillus TaxID=1386 RepID=UPI0006F5D129|nr:MULTISPECIES: DUF5970 family protein [Bacillus]KQU13490.1 hypothetical protein ASG46_04430 [Bacillus sp. Leaf49]MCY7623056.1 DUF5970 family protein [Bacillus altitudinis]MDI6559183.1 DUF5970 family protein [Bacillus altitudinis]MED0851414.1 DUF5970 family protein [Bacillus altitudinis]CAI7726310.1 hypothetical protein WT0BACILLUS_03043 [Bacillus altitudinis]
MKSKNGGYLYLLWLPVIIGAGYGISLFVLFLQPVLTLGIAGLYIFIFGDFQVRQVRYIFMFVFLINVLFSVMLFLDI